jgi:uncharacterized protein YdaU (DUF1376 family)
MAADKLPMLPWFPRDFLSATRGWKLVERGLYRELLDAQWEMGALPNDPDELADIAGAKTSEFASAWPKVRNKFVDDGSGKLINLKLEEHRASAIQRLRDHSKAGRIGGLASAASRASKRQASVEQPFNERSTNVQPDDQAESKPPSPSPSPSPSPPPSRSSDSQPDSPNIVETSSGAQTRSRAERPKAERGARLPEPFFLTTDMQRWAKVNAPHVELRGAMAEFCDFWRAVPGARGRKLDWIGTWRNRMRELEAKAVMNGAGRDPARPVAATKYDRIREALSDD